MRVHFRRDTVSDEHPEIVPLDPREVRSLRLPWLSRFSHESLAFHLQLEGSIGLWVPKTGEYVVAEQWRRRTDIAHIAEVTARRGKHALVTSLLDRLCSMGYQMAVLADDAWHSDPAFFRELGFAEIEKIVFFEKTLPRSTAHVSPQLEGHPALPQLRYANTGLESLDVLLHLDHNSFPWLWWNSRDEFEFYLQMPGVQVYTAFLGDEPVGYASYTMYQGWAHLDRLAVVESQQGRKYGAAQLVHILNVMAASGAGSVALSTQASNLQSHRLYNGFGFKQTSETMRFYGMSLQR